MPSLSGKQHRLMEAVAHDPNVSRETGIPQKVGADFAAADKAQGKTFAQPHHGRGRKADHILRRSGDA